MNIQASLILQDWLERNRTTILRAGIKFELRLQSEKDTFNKAALTLDARSMLASLTVWGNGMVEYIVVNGDSGDDISSTDVECKDECDLDEKLDGFLLNFRELIADNG